MSACEVTAPALNETATHENNGTAIARPHCIVTQHLVKPTLTPRCSTPTTGLFGAVRQDVQRTFQHGSLHSRTGPPFPPTGQRKVRRESEGERKPRFNKPAAANPLRAIHSASQSRRPTKGAIHIYKHGVTVSQNSTGCDSEALVTNT